MLRLGTERDRLTIVGDQIGGPTAAGDIAAACLKVADALGQSALATGLDIPGTYHFSGAPEVSWADFATEIFHQAGITCDVVAIPSSDYPTTAARPFNSRMACSTTQDAFGIPRPDWKQSLSLVLADLSESI
jgi:dTDP-4-dehydrorhamnose reductase